MKLENNIPMPAPKKGNTITKQVASVMDVGQSTLATKRQAESICYHLWNAGKRGSYRTLENGEIRVWRVA